MGTSPWTNAVRLPIINRAKVSSTKHFLRLYPAISTRQNENP
jgi:hypothetical protein